MIWKLDFLRPSFGKVAVALSVEFWGFRENVAVYDELVFLGPDEDLEEVGLELPGYYSFNWWSL